MSVICVCYKLFVKINENYFLNLNTLNSEKGTKLRWVISIDSYPSIRLLVDYCNIFSYEAL